MCQRDLLQNPQPVPSGPRRGHLYGGPGGRRRRVRRHEGADQEGPAGHQPCSPAPARPWPRTWRAWSNRNPELIRPIENPYSADGGIAVLKGNLAPEGCVVKRSAVAPEMMRHTGPARVFDSEEEAIAAIYAGKIVAGDVVVIRYEGPKGGPGMREMLNPTSAICGMGLGEAVALITDGRFSGATRGRLHRPRLPRGRPGRPHRPGGGGGHHFHRHPRLQNRAPGGRGHPGRPACQVDLSRSPRSRPAIWPGMQNWSPPPPGAPFWNNQKLPRGQTPRELLIIVPECCCRRGSGSRLGRCSPGRRGSHGSPSRRSWPPCRSCRG